MNQAQGAKLYFLFALLLLAIAWKITHATAASLHKAQAAQAAQLEKALADN